MTRKRLNLSEHAKDFIVESLVNKTSSVTTLANLYGCHPRSINRVMEERGMAAVTSKAKGMSDVSRLKAVLAKSGLTITELEQLVGITSVAPIMHAHLRTAALFRPGNTINEFSHVKS